jgi:hypothetical protein
MNRRRMSIQLSIAALFLLPAYAIVSCEEGGQLRAPTSPVEPGALSNASAFDSTVTLAIGEVVLLDRGRLQLALRAIDGDSRCPRDVRCLQAGTVRGRIEASGSMWSFEVLEGSLQPFGEFTTQAAGRTYTLRVRHVEPYPRAGVTTPPGAYTVGVGVTVVSR